MTRATAALAVLLSYAVLTIWIDQRWAWGAAQCAVFVFMGGWAAVQLRRPSPVRGSLWLAPLCAVPVWGLLQLATQRTVYRWGTWNAVLNWATWLGLFFLALQLLQQSAARRWFLRFAMYFGAGLCVLATVQMYTSGGKIFWIFPSGYTVSVLGPFVNRNQYAAFLEMILPIALWQALRDRRLEIAHYAIAAAMLASVVAAASRAGSILMCMEAAAVLLAAWRRGMAPGGAVARGLPSSPCYSPRLPVGRHYGSASGNRIRPTAGARSWSPRWLCCATGLSWVSVWGTGRAPILNMRSSTTALM
jgi:hypothetical protein